MDFLIKCGLIQIRDFVETSYLNTSCFRKTTCNKQFYVGYWGFRSSRAKTYIFKFNHHHFKV